MTSFKLKGFLEATEILRKNKEDIPLVIKEINESIGIWNNDINRFENYTIIQEIISGMERCKQIIGEFNACKTNIK